MGSLDLEQLHRQDKPSGWKKPGIALFEKSSSSQVTSNRISASASDDVHLAAQPAPRPMDDAVDQWKAEFPMHHFTRERIKSLQDQNSRKSKHKARDLRNGAFAAYLMQTAIHKQLALACLKSATATVHTLLQAWSEYMQSTEHEKEKQRSRLIKPEDEEGINEKKRQRELNIKVHALRQQNREMRKENTAKNDPQKWYTHQNQLQQLTLQHGYGKLPWNGKILLPRYDLLHRAAPAAPPGL